MQGDNFSRALAEVDGLYKSGRLGAQERATARIGELIAAYSEEPHALGQLFARLGNTFQKHEENYMRWCVVCVLERVGRYLPRAAGWDGFVQSLQMLTASNDNVAHALALRAFVPIAGLLGGDLTVHHSVIRGLESESPAVLGAALMAADAIAACSVKFAAAIFPHVAQVATAPRAPCAADMRLSLRVRAVRILRHMHGTAELTRRAHLFCGELLRGAGRGEDALVEEVLRTMTALAAQSLVDVDAHVTTLQRLVTKPELGSNSSDNSVVRTALECMGILARVSSRAPFSGSLLLATAGNSALPDETRAAALTVAKILARRPLLHNLLPEAGTLGPSEQVCAALAPALAGPSTDVAAAAYALAGTLARHPDASDVERAAYAALVLNALRSELAGSPRWELLLASVDAIGCLQAHCAASSGEASVATSVAAALCAACSSGESSAPLIAKFVLGVSRVAPSLLGPPFAASIAPTLTSGRTDVLADLGAAALRIQDGLSYAEKVAQALLAVGDNWGCFKVARTAACVGAHAFAASLWAALHELKSVASRSVHLWLAVLHHVSVAESALARPDARRAVFHMKAAITLLKVLLSATPPLHFISASRNMFLSFSSWCRRLRVHRRPLPSSWRSCKPVHSMWKVRAQQYSS